MILVPAVISVGDAGRTADRWAWPVKPELTPIFLGSGYGAGAYFFWRTFRARRWHPSSAGVLGASVFAALMLVATLIHWDRFNHGDAPFVAAFAFWGWTIVYIVSPLVVFALWWRNRATDPGEPDAGDPVLSPAVLLAARAVGVGALAAAAVAFLSPSTAIDVWPWDLTPLTARVLASFTAQVGVGALVLSLDRRWSTWRLIVQTFFVATALLFVGARARVGRLPRRRRDDLRLPRRTGRRRPRAAGALRAHEPLAGARKRGYFGHMTRTRRFRMLVPALLLVALAVPASPRRRPRARGCPVSATT